MPAQLHVKTQMEQNASQMFYVRIANFPDLYAEKNILKFLTKKIPSFNHSKLVCEKNKANRFTGSCLIQANNRPTINALLLLHDYRLQGHRLQTWLMGFEYEASSLQMIGGGSGSTAMLSETDVGSMQHYEEIFSNVNSVEESKTAAA